MRYLAAALLLCATTPAAFAVQVEIILDASGSMRAAAGERTRMEAAREAVKTTVDAIPADSVVALRLYGHRVDKDDREASCRDSELAIPFGRLEPRRFAAAVDAAEPRGQTPLAYSLEQAAQDLAGSDQQGVVVLVSDGEESCGGDPRAVACKLAAAGLDLTVHTVGFGVDAAARRQLEAIAACTGGEYRDARDAAALAGSLQELVQASLVLDKERQVVGGEVRGGDGFASAVPLAPGATYRLDHHLGRDQEDYFAIDVSVGQKLVAAIQAHEVGIAISGGRASEQPHSSCAGVAVHGPDRQRIATRWAHQPGQEVGVSVPLGEGQEGRYYVLVGALGCPGSQHKDSRFRLDLVDLTDAGSGTDAGAGRQRAVPIAAGEHRGWLHANDRSDYFALGAAAGATYDVAVTPEQAGKHLQLTVYDRDGRRLARAGHRLDEPGATLRLEGLEVPPGAAFVEVAEHPIGRHESGRLESAYTLAVAANLAPQVASPGDASLAAGTAPASLPATATSALEVEAAGGNAPRSSLGRLAKAALRSGVPFLLGLLLGGILGSAWMARRR